MIGARYQRTDPALDVRRCDGLGLEIRIVVPARECARLGLTTVHDTGVGKLSIATKITAKKDTIELENFSSEPVRLTEVKKVK